jgi:peptide/nickel transport system permease protein
LCERTTIKGGDTMTTEAARRLSWRQRHDLAPQFLYRLGYGVVTLFVISVIVFWATQALPGNAATAILGTHATPALLKQTEQQLHLDQPVLSQYWAWLTGMLHGNFGDSLASAGQSVWSLVKPRLINSAVLVVLAAFFGSIIGIPLAIYSALNKDKLVDRVLAVVTLSVSAVPDFVIAVFLVTIFATVVWRIFPAVSVVPLGEYAWNTPRLLILPVATLAIVILPYIYRMTRGALIDALESDYVELARLKGLKSVRVAVAHALPNALAPVIQVSGLNFIYLAGGIVLVEYIFNFPGVGQGLVNAVSDRDVPTIQFIVVALAAFYIVINILADMAVLVVTPRRRYTKAAAA